MGEGEWRFVVVSAAPPTKPALYVQIVVAPCLHRHRSHLSVLSIVLFPFQFICAIPPFNISHIHCPNTTWKSCFGIYAINCAHLLQSGVSVRYVAPCILFISRRKHINKFLIVSFAIWEPSSSSHNDAPVPSHLKLTSIETAVSIPTRPIASYCVVQKVDS